MRGRRWIDPQVRAAERECPLGQAFGELVPVRHAVVVDWLAATVRFGTHATRAENDNHRAKTEQGRQCALFARPKPAAEGGDQATTVLDEASQSRHRA